jgi:hypothetical protein
MIEQSAATNEPNARQNEPNGGLGKFPKRAAPTEPNRAERTQRRAE